MPKVPCIQITDLKPWRALTLVSPWCLRQNGHMSTLLWVGQRQRPCGLDLKCGPHCRALLRSSHLACWGQVLGSGFGLPVPKEGGVMGRATRLNMW